MLVKREVSCLHGGEKEAYHSRKLWSNLYSKRLSVGKECIPWKLPGLNFFPLFPLMDFGLNLKMEDNSCIYVGIMHLNMSDLICIQLFQKMSTSFEPG